MMTKIVINADYGGFSISEAAVYALAARKGLTVYKEGVRWQTTYWTVPPTDPGRVRFHTVRANWVNVSISDRHAADAFYTAHTLNTRPEDRTDPDLIAVIEELGEAANGDHATLEIVDLPPGTMYRITEYDGYESVETQENTEWKVA